MDKHESEAPSPWITIYDKYGDPSNALVGNKVELCLLGKKIEEALENGKAILDDNITADFNEIRIETEYPELGPETAGDKVLKYFFLLFGAVIIGIFLFGCYSLIQLL